jgi:hypothetical protein
MKENLPDHKDAPVPVTVTSTAVDTLNAFLKSAPEACAKLLDQRIEVPSGITDKVFVSEAGAKPKVGFLGILNSILHQAGQPRVASMHGAADELVGFTTYKPNQTEFNP